MQNIKLIEPAIEYEEDICLFVKKFYAQMIKINLQVAALQDNALQQKNEFKISN